MALLDIQPKTQEDATAPYYSNQLIGGQDTYMRSITGTRAQSGRIALASLAVVVAAVLMVVESASATTNFGTRNYNAAKRYGGQVNITTPAISGETISSGEISLSRIVAQSTFSSGAGLVQAGLYRSGMTAQLDTCGTSVDRYTMYTEVLKAGTNNYVCSVSGTAMPGYENQASIFSDGTNSTQWQASVQSDFDATGPFLDPTTVGFSLAFVAIGGELNGAGVPAGSQAGLSSTRICYGCGANTFDPFYGPGWYVYTNTSLDKGGRQVTTPSTTNLYTPSTGWTVPNVPTPLTISHTP